MLAPTVGITGKVNVFLFVRRLRIEKPVVTRGFWFIFLPFFSRMVLNLLYDIINKPGRLHAQVQLF